ALRGQRRGHVLVEHGQVNTARDRVVGAGHVDAVGGRADVGAGGEVQVLAAAVEHGVAHVAHAVGDLVAAAGGRVVQQRGPHAVLERLGVDQPTAVRRPDLIE